MNLSLSFEPLVSWPLLGIAAIVLSALALFGLWRRARGAWLRLAAAAALSLSLANPVFLSEDRDPVKTVVALIADRSQSQSLGTRTAETDAAIAAVKARLSRFKQFEVREIDAGKGGSAEDRASTRLFAALADIFRDVPPNRIAGAILVTDGQVHDVPKDIAALGFDAPVHALVTGRDKEFDRSVRFTQSPRFGLAGKPSQMELLVTDDGPAAAGAEATVRVFVNGEQVAQQSAQIGAKTTLEVPLGRAGANIVELATDVLPNETSESNNRAVATVDAIRENLRVLLVSGEPHAGERTWRNLLKSDASVDLVHFTILRPPEKQDGTPINELSLIAFPTRELFVERIKDFDLIIFDRYQHRDVLPTLYYDYIAQYVEQGGALLVAAGPEYAGEATIANTPLAAALPALPTGAVSEEGFRPELTELGKRHPVTRGLEGSETSPPKWSRWFRLIGVTPPDGETIMQGAGGQPLLVLNRKGEGRVGMFLSDQAWLWARGFEGGGPHVSLYRRIAHWLMKEPELEEEALSAAAKGETLEVTRQTMAEEAGKAEVILPSGKTASLAMLKSGDGQFSAKLETSEVGLFRVANGDLSTLVHVGPVNAPEFLSTVSTLDMLAPLAKQTGGVAIRLAGASVPDILPVRGKAQSDGGRWLGLKTTDETILRSVSRLPMFAGLVGLALLLFALGSVWYREGR